MNNRLYRFGNPNSNTILLQMVDERDLQGMEQEVTLIQELSGTEDFLMAAVRVPDWNADLSPWPAPAAFGKEDFSGNAEAMLQILEGEILPTLCEEKKSEEVKFYLGGYSLAGLFALWTAAKSSRYQGIAAASPSVWFPGFTDYMKDHPVHAESIYLSLGDKESKTKNPVMATVKEAILQTEEILKRQGVFTVLEWNPGNHFKEPELRTAKGFAWLIK